VRKRFGPILVLTAACWVVFVVNNLLWNGHLNQYGIKPRHLASLPCIVWAPLLHASFRHLAANTLPLLVLGGILCARSKAEFGTVAGVGALLSGGLIWLLGRGNTCHVGASGLIFCFFGYLASLAYFRRTFGTLVLSFLVIVFYGGGILLGLVPRSGAVSWEGHLAGLAAGIVLAGMGTKLVPQESPRAEQEKVAQADHE
jgi:membrane associated rhomboid family serine protease